MSTYSHVLKEDAVDGRDVQFLKDTRDLAFLVAKDIASKSRNMPVTENERNLAELFGMFVREEV